jgi:hypothetical protein
MSKENVELLRRTSDAANRGVLKVVIALVDPPPEYEAVRRVPDLAGVRRGSRD